MTSINDLINHNPPSPGMIQAKHSVKSVKKMLGSPAFARRLHGRNWLHVPPRVLDPRAPGVLFGGKTLGMVGFPLAGKNPRNLSIKGIYT